MFLYLQFGLRHPRNVFADVIIYQQRTTITRGVMGRLRIILGSSSRWRAEILEKEGYKNIDIIPPNIDEQQECLRSDNPPELVLKVASAKLEKVISEIPPIVEEGDQIFVICCDMVVVCNNRIREKPKDEEECKEFLRSYSQGSAAEGVCGVVVYNYQTQKSAAGVEVCSQYFKPMSEEFIQHLITIGNVMQCCGGFTIEDMADYLADRIGDETTIIGLPRILTSSLLSQIGYPSP